MWEWGSLLVLPVQGGSARQKLTCSVQVGMLPSVYPYCFSAMCGTISLIELHRTPALRERDPRKGWDSDDYSLNCVVPPDARRGQCRRGQSQTAAFSTSLSGGIR